ncbi:MAG: PQQ-binding-like beta-propeller repeat protein [Saprospiraceae bacterium]|nr:PQQ-binding-like beta-propeller repeat protein [Saprospiraceae bacterium]
MKKIIAIIFIGTLLSCSCTKEDNSIPIKTENGVISEKPYLWWNKEEEHDQFIITTPLIYNKSFIAETHQNGRSYMSLQCAKNGKIIWKWDEYERLYDLELRHPYSNKKILFFQSGPRTYCINMETGKTEWKKTWDKALYDKCSGYQNDFFELKQYHELGEIYPEIDILDISNGSIKGKIIPKFVNTTSYNVLDELGDIHSVSPFEKNGKVYLLITYNEAISYSKSIPLISLYNYTDKTWVYEYKKITNLEQGGLGFVDIQYDKIYHDGASHVFCNDLWTGDSIWTQKFNGNFLFGSCLVDNGTMYCAAEGDGYYALDAETGAIKWKGERAPGTSSRMVILNGVLYYINGGDGRLWALDAATGKTLWRLKSPDNNFGFKREINVMQGDGERKGYVLTSTWHGACAYEAER